MGLPSFPFLFTVVLLIYQYFQGCGACWVEEKAALLDVKTNFCPPGTIWRINWDTGDDCCRWNGVTCDSVKGRITSLDLTYACSFIEGGTPLLNSTLFLPLYELHSLSLADNYFDGCIPGYGFETLSSLSKLEGLDLSSNNFNESIFDSLVRISSLKTLLMSDNMLSDALQIEKLAALNLEVLDLSGNNFNDSIMDSLVRISSLKTILIGYNMLSDALQIEKLAAVNLEVLDLSGNRFSGAIFNLSGWPFLKALSLAYNSFDGILSIEGLCKVGKLQELDIGYNNFTGMLPSCLENLTSLVYLDLSDNNLQIKFPTVVFTNLTSLKYVSLSRNRLEGFLSLSTFSNNSKLKILEISSQSNNFQVGTEFPKANPSFQLEGLELAVCNLNNGTFPSFLLNQHELYYLDLSHNQLQGSFPSWLIQNNSKLQYLILRNNSFTGPLFLPSQTNSNLSYLDASQNKLSGALPSDIHIKIPSLSFLNLSRNHFEGALPLGFRYLELIFALDISYNNISDHVENALQGNLTHLQYLYLSNNSFFGSLPNLTKVRFMIDLVLDKNLITGEIPKSICNVKFLSYIDLSNNKLNGCFPSCLDQINYLEVLNLRGNSLEGPLPISMCNMQHLQFVDLSGNNFSGSLPSCLNLSSLQYLHLRQNSFSGTLPVALSNSPNLKSIDMSGNKFSGAIPRWINETFVKMRVLLLKGNEFKGPIPEQICHLKQLLILDLSHNYLSGTIPSCLRSMGSEGAIYSFQYAYKYGFVSELMMPSYDPLLEPRSKTYGTFQLRLDQEEFMTKSRSDYYKGDILNNLSGIDLSCNHLKGHIPKELGSMNWILALNLSNNELDGSIPKLLSNLTKLESLDLSHNALTGEIPRELTKLNYLESFSVAYNNLSGATLGTIGQFITFGSSSYEGNPGLCGPPLAVSCTKVPPTSATGDSDSETEGQGDLLILVGSLVVSFVVSFWGSIAVLYFNRSWNRAFCMAVDKYTDLVFVKAALLLKRARSN